MFKSKIIAVLLGCCFIGGLCADAKPADCSSMSQEFQDFAGQLTPLNRATFCGQFTDGQRASAMQMASKQDATGTVITPDMAVQKIAGASGANPGQKTPTGCPVK